MSTAMLSEFRQNQAQYIAAAQVEPVELRSRAAQTRAILVSPAFYAEALEALEERRDRRTRDELERWLQEDLAQAVRDYEEHPDEVYTLDALRTELGLT
ncbi:MAG: toxin-antitoxin system antitoxin subunit [Pauljensenia sp.]